MFFSSIPFITRCLPMIAFIFLVLIIFLIFFFFPPLWLGVSLVFFLCTWIVPLRFLMNFIYLSKKEVQIFLYQKSNSKFRIIVCISLK